jgi:hypothetical protein
MKPKPYLDTKSQGIELTFLFRSNDYKNWNCNAKSAYAGTRHLRKGGTLVYFLQIYITQRSTLIRCQLLDA